MPDTPRRRKFKATTVIRGKTMGGMASEFGVSYNHLILVLDGVRRGSRELETKIDEFVRESQTIEHTRRQGDQAR